MDVLLAYVAVGIVVSLPVAAFAGLGWASLYRWRISLAVGTIAQGVWLAAGGLVLVAYAAGGRAASYTAAALVLTGLAASLLLVARRTRRHDLAAAGFLCSTVAVLLQLVAFLANSDLGS